MVCSVERGVPVRNAVQGQIIGGAGAATNRDHSAGITGRVPRRAIHWPARAANWAGASVSARAPGSTPSRDDRRDVEHARQRVAQRLAALRERGQRPRAANAAGSPSRKRRLGDAACSAKNVEVTCGGGLKAPGADVEQRLHRDVRREHDREPAVVARARRGRHARDDFLLQHEVHVDDRVELRDEVEQQRRRDVVGQVADQAQLRPVAAQRAKVELERVGAGARAARRARGNAPAAAARRRDRFRRRRARRPAAAPAP